MTSEGGREPGVQELADVLGWQRERAVEVLRAERPHGDAEGMDLVSSEAAEAEFEQLLEHVTSEQVRPLMMRLTEAPRVHWRLDWLVSS